VTGGLKRCSQVPKRILVLLIALTLIRGLLYAAITIPWWAGHDEEFHFAHIRILADQWSAKDAGQDQDWQQEMTAAFEAFPQGWWYGVPGDRISSPLERYTRFQRVSLAYYPNAWLTKMLLNQDVFFQLFVLRLVAVLVTCGTILFAFLSARKVFHDSLMMQILVPWIIIFNPSFMVTGSTVSDANLAILLSGIVFYLLLLEIERPSRWRSALALVLTAAALWTKATAYFLVFVWVVLIVVYIWRRGREKWVWLGIMGAVLIVSLFLLPGKFQNSLAISLSSLESGLNSEGVAYVFSFTYLWSLVASFWIVLGWFVYPLAPVWYNILFVFLLLAAIGLLGFGWRCVKERTPSSRVDRKGLLLALLFVGLCVSVLIGYSAQIYGALGRYGRLIFPVIVPLSILVIAGWQALLPTRWRSAGAFFIAGFFVLFDTMVLLDYAIPWYYPFWPL
jgi:hypothetical protein